MSKRLFTIALLSTISTAFFAVRVDAANKTSSCNNIQPTPMTLSKSVNKAKSDKGNTLIARRRLRVVWYYSDSTYTKKVGWGKFNCDGSSTLSGQSTPYSREVLNEPCSGPNPA